MIMTSDGVKRGTGFRRMPVADRWDPTGWDQLRGIPWELSAPRPAAGERLIAEDRLVVPLPPPEERLAPPQRRRLYIRREDVHKHGATDGCPGCKCVLEDRRTTVPHTEACRARIIEAMEKDETGAERIQSHAKRRKDSQATERQKPAVVSTGEKDLSVEDAEGRPQGASGADDPPPEIPEDPQERADLKRQTMPMPSAAEPKAKQKTVPQSVKRTGELKIGTGPPLTKAKPTPTQGVKRTAEEGTGDLEERTTAEQAAVPDAVPAVESVIEEAQDLRSVVLTRLKTVAMENIKTLVEETYKRNSIDITAKEVSEIASLSCEMAATDIAEVYSPKRFTALAQQYKLRPGFAVDLCETKANGEFWNLNKPADVEELFDLIDQEEPLLITGSPPCHLFSKLQAISWNKIPPEVREKRMKEALHHLHMSCDVYEKQIQEERFFLHEAPWGATSWKDERVERISSRDDVYVVRGPMCKWGMTATDRRGLQGTGYVRKETGWMTNHPGLAKLLETECTNKTGEAPWHRHIHLIGGIAQQAAKYPPKLVRAVLKCLKDELVSRGELNAADAYSAGPVPELPTVDPEWEEQYVDDVNGGILPRKEVEKAREVEMQYLHKQEVYTPVPIEQCFEDTGKPPIKVRWLDTNKGDPSHPNYRSRLVVKDVKAAKKPEDQLPANLLFSSTPPLEAMRLLCSLWATKQRSAHGEKLKLGLWDISRAHFYGTPKRKIYIEIPSEDPRSEGGTMCGLLQKSMYGTQDAPNIWQAHYSSILLGAGYERGKSNASVFYHPAHDVRVMVHGDDFLALGDQMHLNELERLLRKSYELKCLGIIGDQADDKKEFHFLNRLIRCGECEGRPAIWIEPDRRHVDLLIQTFGMQSAKGAESPDIKKSADQQALETRSPLLPKEAASEFRSAVMRAAYLSQDRPDISHAVKNLARRLVQPTEASLTDLKRLIRYLIRYPDFAQVFKSQKTPERLVIQVDSDHAGDTVTRKSTTGMIAYYGRHVLKHSSNVQSTIALSTGESEYYALVKGGSTGLGIQSLLADYGITVAVTIESDSNAAKGTVNRVGLGKARHIQTRYLWLQERVAENHLKVVHVPGKQNGSDVLTKSVPGTQMHKTMLKSGYVYLTDRSKGQLNLLK